ncbi:hypothetical protein Taro_036890 [Colocasia esculenta]|uniref:Uncharacterized protein n=1 Tax=Colocasia esculenta TaxID=4460 RepID=A0A843WJ47_COLES|nr:hypothetical protein [Colocasia esculenta]
MSVIELAADRADSGAEGKTRYAASVGLAGAFWRVFPERCLGGSGGGSPRTVLCCFCSSAGCSILSDVSCCLVVWVVHSGEGSSQDHPMSLLVEVLPRSALRSFRATVVWPCGSKCVVWLGCVLVRFSQDGSWRFGGVPEPRSGVRREAAAWPGCGVVCVVRFCGRLVSPFAGVEAGATLASKACGLRVPLLAASGGGLVVVVVTTFPHGVSKCSPVALAVRSGTSVYGFPTLRCTRGPGWFCLWALDPVEIFGSVGGDASFGVPGGGPGASKRNPGTYGGGGCVKDSKGNLVLAFAHYYGFGGRLLLKCALSVTVFDWNQSMVSRCPLFILILLLSSLPLIPRNLHLGSVCVGGVKFSHIFTVHMLQWFILIIKLTRWQMPWPIWVASLVAIYLPHECKGPLTLDRSGIPNLRPA